MSLTRSLQTYVLALGFAAALPPGLAAAAAVQGVVIDPDGRVTPGSAQELAAHTRHWRATFTRVKCCRTRVRSVARSSIRLEREFRQRSHFCATDNA